MENIVFERNYETTEKDDRATAVFERAFAPGGFMEEFTKKMDAIPHMTPIKIKTVIFVFFTSIPEYCAHVGLFPIIYNFLPNFDL